MARQKSEFLSALGILFEIIKSLIEEVKDLGGSDEHIRRIGSDRKLRRKLAELIVESGKAALGVFRVAVNYDDPRFHGAFRKDDYTFVNSDLKPEHFPIERKGTAAGIMEELVFDHEPTTQEVLDTIESRGLRRPDRAESESFIDQNPDEKDKYPIIGLCGSIVQRWGARFVAYVSARESDRGLRFDWLDRRWAQDCRFLAVRK